MGTVSAMPAYLYLNKYQLSLIDPHDCIVLQTELDDRL